jgi:CubicO group peptidase (beta-lactamase class C family)
MKISMCYVLSIYSWRKTLCLLVATIAGSMFVAAICGEAAPNQATVQAVWPTKEWQTSTPEQEGMNSSDLAGLIDFGAAHNLDSLLIVRHGKIVVEAYYAPYAAGIPHAMYSATKAVIGTLVAIASKEGRRESMQSKGLGKTALRL